MKARSTINNGYNYNVGGWIFLLVIIIIISAIVTWNTNGATLDSQPVAFLAYAASIAGISIGVVGIMAHRAYAFQSVSKTVLVMKNGLIAFKDEESGLWGLLSKTEGVLAQPQFKHLTIPEPDPAYGEDQDFIRVVDADGRTDAFSISKQETVIPKEYEWVKSIGNGYHTVADPNADTQCEKMVGVFCTNTCALVAPIDFHNFSRADENYAVFYESEFADNLQGSVQTYGLYSVTEQRILIPIAFGYKSIGLAKDGSFRLGRVTGYSNRGKWKHPIWQYDTFSPEEGQIEMDLCYQLSNYDHGVEYDDGTKPRFNAETGQVILQRLGLKMIYPHGTKIKEAQPA